MYSARLSAVRVALRAFQSYFKHLSEKLFFFFLCLYPFILFSRALTKIFNKLLEQAGEKEAREA